MAARKPFPFRLKALAALALVILADVLFFQQTFDWTARWPGGWTLGGFALACAACVAVSAPAVRRQPGALACLALATLLGVILLDQPSLLGWSLFWLSLTCAGLAVRVWRLNTAALPVRLVWHAVASLVGPVIDLIALKKLHRGPLRLRIGRIALLLALPVVGGGVFLLLFAAANPLIGEALDRMRELQVSGPEPARMLFWIACLIVVWGFLRPRGLKLRLWSTPTTGPGLPVPPAASLILSLAVFNAVFALQNGLDVAFLWSGARLPHGMSLADYAHHGAYPLIATALLAGAFVLVALKPGSATARMPAVRWLLVAWVAQNIFLVASSMLRTADYIQAYSLTRLRIAALVWMTLVALGLVLICWRMLAGKTAGWLVRTNGAALLAVLVAVSAIDTGAIAAAWNVRHNRQATGAGAEIDLDYLGELGPSALVSLAWLEQHAPQPGLRAQAHAERIWIETGVRRRQADWRGWTWRNARRLQAVHSLDAPLTSPAGRGS